MSTFLLICLVSGIFTVLYFVDKWNRDDFDDMGW